MKPRSYDNCIDVEADADPLAKWPGWMRQPEDCSKDGHPVEEGLVLVSPSVCEYFCDSPCKAYVDYCKQRHMRYRRSARERSHGDL